MGPMLGARHSPGACRLVSVVSAYFGPRGTLLFRRHHTRTSGPVQIPMPLRPATLASLLTLLLAGGPAAAASPFDGLWCGTGLLRDFSLHLTGRDTREVEGRLVRRDRVRDVKGEIEGKTGCARRPRATARWCWKRPAANC